MIQKFLIHFVIMLFAQILISGCGKNENPVTASEEINNKSTSKIVKAPSTNVKSTAARDDDTINNNLQSGQITDAEAITQITVSDTVSLQKIKHQLNDYNSEILHGVALKYKDKLSAKNLKLGALQNQLIQLSHEEKLSKKGIVLEREIKTCSRSIKALKVRLDTYCNALKEKGKDISDLNSDS